MGKIAGKDYNLAGTHEGIADLEILSQAIANVILMLDDQKIQSLDLSMYQVTDYVEKTVFNASSAAKRKTGRRTIIFPHCT